MKKLAKQATLVGGKLYVGDKIKLIIYDSNGHISQTHIYDHGDMDYCDRLQYHIAGIAKKLRKEWGSDFLELASVAFQQELTIEIGEYSANLVSATAQTLLECPFSSDGLGQMSSYLADNLLDRSDARIYPEQNVPEREEEEAKIMEGIVMTKKLADAVIAIIGRMSAEERQGLKEYGSKDANELISSAYRFCADNY